MPHIFSLTATLWITPLIRTLFYSRLVLETLEPLSVDRKCFRLINGVLVERTVKDVVPALKTNQEGLKKVLDDLVKQYKNKQDELDKWKVRIPPLQRQLAFPKNQLAAAANLDIQSNRRRTTSR